MPPGDTGSRQDRDLVLPPGTYANVLDSTKGSVSVWVGPASTTLTNTEESVVWTGRKWSSVDMSQAIQAFVKATENQYVVLRDPSSEGDETFPSTGSKTVATQLNVGKRIVIPGPTTFALWPGQTAEVIDGHDLKSNEYLIAKVYEPEAARANMERAITAPQTDPGAEPEGKKPKAPAEREQFTMGERIVIRGTQYSYYVPPTGIEVVPLEGSYVREACTLEQLEYAVLRDENGRKRYERGPAVVFPKATEAFVMEKGERRFRAIELNPQSGLYIKAVATYTHDEDYDLQAWRGNGLVTVTKGEEVQEGDELFLTGKDQPIYFPRAEQSVILYGNQRKSHAVAVPTGEGRYVLDRTTGEVDLVEGPEMFLPDPRTQVVVRRVLDARAVEMMYPGNTEAAQVNALWRNEQAGVEEEYLPASDASRGESGSLAISYQRTSGEFAGEKMRRGTQYTPPRTITLDTKYQGAVRISPWPGYAVLITDPSGNRRVERGPKDILLEYHEALMPLTLSTGRPKNDSNPLRTVYLRVVNNAVTDRVTVETKDLVPVTIDLSLRVNFEGDDETKWFDVEDYVALLTDHCRSLLRNTAKRHDIQEFYEQTIDIIRDALLGKAADGGRKGRTFNENGMRLYDVEVLGVQIDHPNVEALLAGAMNTALEGAIQLSVAQQRAERDAKLEEIERDRIVETEKTAEKRNEAQLANVTRQLDLTVSETNAELTVSTESAKIAELARIEDRKNADQTVGIRKDLNEVELARLRVEVEQFVTRMGAVSPAFISALQAFGDQEFTRTIVERIGPAAWAAGMPTGDLLARAFEGTPLEAPLKALLSRPGQNGHATVEVEAPTS